MEQQIRFCKSFDGTRIAYALSGEGPPLVMAPHWLAPVELTWDSPLWRPWLQALSRSYALLRMDERGCGLSDRDAGDLSFDALVRDLAVVVDAAGYEKFALYGTNQGGPIAIEYAARYPERVTHLVLFNSYARGWLKRGLSPLITEECEARIKLFELGWDRDEPHYRQLVAAQHVARGATLEELRTFAELMRQAVPARNLVPLIRSLFSVDVTAAAVRLSCPVLVVHSRGASRLPFEEGRFLASLIPGARFVPLETPNNVLLEREPSFARFFSELGTFISPSVGARFDARFERLSAREVEILEHLARGLDNAQIAAQLALSEKTVRNYVSQIFDKLQVENRGQAIVLARRAGLGGERPAPVG